MSIPERLTNLRAIMAEKGIDVYDDFSHLTY